MTMPSDNPDDNPDNTQITTQMTMPSDNPDDIPVYNPHDNARQQPGWQLLTTTKKTTHKARPDDNSDDNAKRQHQMKILTRMKFTFSLFLRQSPGRRKTRMKCPSRGRG
jgi:hypothetical protein